MAGDLVFLRKCNVRGELNPPTTSLQNCLKFSHSYKYFSLLCDFGIATIAQVDGLADPAKLPEASVLRTLRHGEGETLESHAWSPNDQIYAVLGHKAYLYMVSNDFRLLHTIHLYYIPKDITIATTLPECSAADHLKYKIAIAGPNGVEMYEMNQENSSVNMKESVHLHTDLAIVLVEFSPDLKYLAVAALDCHFGMWNVQSLEGEMKDFWYEHLNTVRITNMAFSGDSQSIAVSCWDGLSYIYTEAKQSVEGNHQSHQWIQHSRTILPSGEKVCGIMTGSLVCWAPGCKSVRFSFANEEGSWLSTYSLSDDKCVTEKVTERGVEVKGLDTLRRPEGNFSVCFLSSRGLLLSKWPDQYKDSSSEEKVLSDVLLYEDLTCSVWSVSKPQQTPGNTLKWLHLSNERLLQLKSFESTLLSMNCAGVATRHTDDNVRPVRTNTHGNNSTTTMRQSSDNQREDALLCGFVDVPFYEPSTHPSELSQQRFVLASTSCIVLVVLPSVAFVYCHGSSEWRSIVFGEAAISCCLVQGQILAALNGNGVLSCWNLNKSIPYLDSLQVHGSKAKRSFIVGDPLRPIALVFDLNSEGDGTVTYLTLQDGKLITTKISPVCVPWPGSHQLTNSTFSVLGCFVFVQSKDSDVCNVVVPGRDDTLEMDWDRRRSSFWELIMSKKLELLGFLSSKKLLIQ